MNNNLAQAAGVVRKSLRSFSPTAMLLSYFVFGFIFCSLSCNIFTSFFYMRFYFDPAKRDPNKQTFVFAEERRKKEGKQSHFYAVRGYK
jgi:hypothetical protein